MTVFVDFWSIVGVAFVAIVAGIALLEAKVSDRRMRRRAKTVA